MDFEGAILRLVNIFNKIPDEEKPSKVRKVLAEEKLVEFVNMCNGLGSSVDTSPTCSCIHCPHKGELLAFDRFYAEFNSPEI